MPNESNQDVVEKQAKEKWRTDAAIRQEFLTESTYIAYCKAIASGSVRIHGQMRLTSSGG